MTKVVVQEDLFDVIEALNRRIKYLEDSLRGGEASVPLDYQIVQGQNSGFAATVNADAINPIWRNAALNSRLQISYTPTVDAWWEVSANATWFRKDAPSTVTGRLELVLSVTPAPVSGQSFVFGPTMFQKSDIPSSGNASAGRTVSYSFPLAAGTAYTVNCDYYSSGAAWSYYQGAGYLWIMGKAIPR